MSGTRGNPRLGQSGVALTSLGAVGGARGTAAGGLRVLVEFITQYNSGDIKNLESDLKQLEFAQRNSEIAERKRLSRIAIAQKQLNEVKIVEQKLTRDQRSALKEVANLEASRNKVNQQRAATLKSNLITELKGTAQSQGLLKGDINLLFRRIELEQKLVRLKEAQERATQGQAQRQRQIDTTQAQLSQAQLGQATLGARLGGLALGAVGGIFGGAVLGVGFTLAQDALEKVGDKIQDLIDPARHAREAVADLGKAVNDVAGQKNLSQLQAAQDIIKQIGLNPNTQPGRDLAGLLQQAAVQQQINDALSEYLKLLDLKINKEGVDKKQSEDNISTFREEARALGTLFSEKHTLQGSLPFGIGNIDTTIEKVHTLTGDITLQEYAQRRLAEITNQLTDAEYKQAQAAKAAALASEQASAIAAIAAENISNAINAAGETATGRIDTKISNLGSGESARTRRLEKLIESAQNASGGGSSNAAALRSIAEQRALILLRQRLRLLGTNINLEKYEGKFLLEAINAKINALQKEGDAQARVNSLLDLQYRMSQTIKRQAGESINEFIERRAQEQRQQLAERDNIDRENQIAKLEAQQQAVQDEVDLAELAQQKKDALNKEGTSNYIDNLRKQLEASKKHDQAVLEAKKKALEAQKAALEKSLSDAQHLLTDAAFNETLIAIKGADNAQKLNIVGGRIAGYKRAKATLQALVEGFGLPAAVAAPLIQRINSLIAGYEVTAASLSHALAKPGQAPKPFAKGGVIDLKNSRSPFGSNVRFGEQGSELGVILSHRVVEALNKQKPTGQIGPFILQKSDDYLRDRYAFGKLVQESVEAALG